MFLPCFSQTCFLSATQLTLLRLFSKLSDTRKRKKDRRTNKILSMNYVPDCIGGAWPFLAASLSLEILSFPHQSSHIYPSQRTELFQQGHDEPLEFVPRLRRGGGGSETYKLYP